MVVNPIIEMAVAAMAKPHIEEDSKTYDMVPSCDGAGIIFILSERGNA